MKEILGLLALALSFANAAVYIHSVLRGKTRPHAFTWGIWALISVVVFAAQTSEGAGPGGWQQALSAVNCTVIMILGFTHGDRKYARSDWAALAFALVSIPLWVFTGTPLWSVILLCLIDAAGMAPTLRKSWHRPEEEPPLPYILWTVAALCSLAAIEHYALTTVLYPLVLALLNFLLVGVIFWRKNMSKNISKQ